MMAGVRVEIKNPAQTLNRLRQAWTSDVLPVLSEQMMTDCNTYVRKQDGTLAESIDHKISGTKLRITWNTAYAKRVYYTGTPRKNVNPNASLRWCEKAIRRHKGDWANQATNLLKR